ncbi:MULTISPECIES: TetR/AcrR family transcriptional regulator [unclassified Nocardioides]|uniref:TetR/AcrR family transcriptional regulator n=1 Tax=unclassified Nocardioides TaxID=2615069 RepID=UPI0009E70D51|nr:MULTISPECIES: TetR/AcrR family transcriptional regulator [unclassified Nocardioides]
MTNADPAADAKPHGREEVRAATLAATRELLAERGPDRFSVRDIAARAGINHALVFRYFGSKSQVVEEMLAQEAQAVAEAVKASGAVASGTSLEDVILRLLGLLAERPTYWRALVNAVLDEPGAAVQGSASTTQVFANLWSSGDPGAADASAVAGVVVLGWLIFGDFMVEATGADSDAVRRMVVAQVTDLIAPAYVP